MKIGWRDISPQEALDCDLPVRGRWQLFGLHFGAWSFSFIARDLSGLY